MRTIIRDNYDPTPNEYHETIVVDEAREKRWLFDCDGVYHDITKVNVVSERGDSEEYAASQKWVTEEVEALEAANQALQDNIDAEEAARIAADETLQDNIDAEEADRIAADTEIWDEIEAIEAASDVVDIVGTYAELQQYDTSKLQDNDIIKVLADETHDDAIAYYRWNKTSSQFAFIGVEGPYYTASETDTLLAAKQDKLIAGTNIQIASDGKTISATDTTYTAGTNVSIDANNVISATDTTYSNFTGTDGTTAGAAGLVPAPATTDAGKFLNADGTWATVQSGSSVTPVYLTVSGNYYYSWKDAAGTVAMSAGEIIEAEKNGGVIFIRDYSSAPRSTYSYALLTVWDQNKSSSTKGTIYFFAANDADTLIRVEPYTSASTAEALYNTNQLKWTNIDLQRKLTAGTGITIDSYSNTISAEAVVAGCTTNYSPYNEYSLWDYDMPQSNSDYFSIYDGGHGCVQGSGQDLYRYYWDKDGAVSIYGVDSVCNIEDVYASAVIIHAERVDNGGDPSRYYFWALIKTKENGQGATKEVIRKFYADSQEAMLEDPYHFIVESETPIGGTTYTAGTNIQINNGVISATDTTYTAGSNISISAQNVISATVPATNNISSNDWTALWQ